MILTDTIFMIVLVLALLAVAPSYAQSLPQNFLGAGAAYNGFSAPHINGWMSYAELVSRKAQLYSFFTHDVTSSVARPFTVQTSVRSGLAPVLRQAGPLYLLAIGDAGMAASGNNVGGAASAGMLSVLKLGRTNWVFVLGYRRFKSSLGVSQTIWESGFGATWD